MIKDSKVLLQQKEFSMVDSFSKNLFLQNAFDKGFCNMVDAALMDDQTCMQLKCCRGNGQFGESDALHAACVAVI